MTLSLAQRDREQPKEWRLHAAGIILASSVMFPRVLVEIAVLNSALLARVAVPIGAAASVGLLTAFVMLRRGRLDGSGPVELRNPLQLGMSLLFGASLALVTLAAVALRRWLGDAGLYATSMIAGVMDVDAVTLTMARLSRAHISPEAGARAILAAVAVNTASKAVIAGVIARGRTGLACAGGLAASLLAGALALALG